MYLDPSIVFNVYNGLKGMLTWIVWDDLSYLFP